MADLNYSDLETLRPKLVPRCTAIVRNRLLYVIGGGGEPAQNQIDWCVANMPNVNSLGEQVSHWCMSEPTFKEDGTAITDADLQSRVENVLNTYFMPAAEV